MKVIILCAGYGKRMRPFTEKFQKVMLPLNEKPLLEYIIEGLQVAGFKDFIFVVGYLKEQIIDYFEKQNNHKIYLLSKCGPTSTKFLTDNTRKQTICAWSINAPIISSRWETRAAHPIERIEAAKGVSDAGYDTRIRIDPIFPVANWKKHYEGLITKIFSSFTPKRIILGTPRGLWKTIKYAKLADTDIEWTRYFGEKSGWGEKLSFNQRKEIYEFMFDKITENGYPKDKISICKDTVMMLKKLNIPYTPFVCNCYGKG